MTFDIDNWGNVGGFHGSDPDTGKKGVGLFSYTTPDALSVVDDAGYFNELRDRVYQGDIVYCNSTVDNDPENYPWDSNDNQYSIIYFLSVPRSPAATNVTINGKDINAG